MFARVEIVINSFLELVVCYTDRWGVESVYRGAEAWRWLWMSRPPPELMPQEPTLEQLEEWYIGRVLARYALRTPLGVSGVERVSKVLGITKKTLWVKRQKYNLDEQIPDKRAADDIVDSPPTGDS